MKGPCYQCAERSAACHSSCPQYAAFRVEHERRKAERAAEKQKTDRFMDVRFRSFPKYSY